MHSSLHIKDDMMKLFQGFHSLMDFDARFSESFISFILKIKSPVLSMTFFPFLC